MYVVDSSITKETIRWHIGNQNNWKRYLYVDSSISRYSTIVGTKNRSLGPTFYVIAV